jgi:hypothetical protein
MPKLVDGRMTLSIAEATHPRILAMYSGELVAGNPADLLIKFPDVLSAASWATTNDLQHCAYLVRQGGPSLGDWAYLEVTLGS